MLLINGIFEVESDVEKDFYFYLCYLLLLVSLSFQESSHCPKDFAFI